MGLVHANTKLPHGYGIFKYHNLCTLECGRWVSGQAYGRCRYAYPNGDVYEGDFSENKRHGKGTLYRHTGAVSSEEYKHGKRVSHVQLVADRPSPKVPLPTCPEAEPPPPPRGKY